MAKEDQPSTITPFSYPALISDVLDGVLSMTEGNWEDKAEELAEMLRPVAQ